MTSECRALLLLLLYGLRRRQAGILLAYANRPPGHPWVQSFGQRITTTPARRLGGGGDVIGHNDLIIGGKKSI